jgi:hypothetical protein
MHKRTITNVILTVFAMVAASHSVAQPAVDTVNCINGMSNIPYAGDTALVASIQKQELSPETKAMLRHIMQYGTADLYEKTPLLFPLDQYNMLRPPYTPYSHHIDQLEASLRKSLRKYYEEYYMANKAGEILSYLSWLLILL